MFTLRILHSILRPPRNIWPLLDLYFPLYMATVPSSPPNTAGEPRDRDSCKLITDSSSNELVFAVVGHAGSGTSLIAKQLVEVLEERGFQVEVLKARTVIKEWAEERGKTLPPKRADNKKLFEDVEKYQDFGDLMRAETTASGKSDYAAVARRLVLKIRAARALKLGVIAKRGEPVHPDGQRRAYIIDSLRHPAEVHLLRAIYRDAFVLVGVVCEYERRISRLGGKYDDAGRDKTIRFMERDAAAKEKHGQQVAKAFELSDFFIDNTIEQFLSDKTSNENWDVGADLSRLVKILTHAELVRPTIGETAMHHAHSAKMRSACLSRQVGAALVDRRGNIVATGTNEAPKAGGGVYGEGFGEELHDGRCSMFDPEDQRFCRNTVEQNKIIKDLIENVPELKNVQPDREKALLDELRSTRIGSLLEFSRAVHAEMDALLSAGRQGVPLTGTRLFVTTFPCHYCARHIIAAGVDEVQYIEPYAKSLAVELHRDAIAIERTGWEPPSEEGTRGKKVSRVLFRPFSGIAPRFYRKAFLKNRDLKNDDTGMMQIGTPKWGQAWDLLRHSYVELEAEFSGKEGTQWKIAPSGVSH